MNKKKIFTLVLCLPLLMLKAQQLNINKSEELTFKQNLQLAQNGSVEAMNKVGIFYKEGVGTQINKKEAINWLSKAAEKGFAKSNYNLGIIYKDGVEGEQDFNKAFYYFKNGALAKDPKSIYAMAYLLYKGFGCNQNYEEAANYFLEGAKNGRANSMYYLGLCYRNGYGISKNIDSARYWLQMALTRGESMAYQELKANDAEHVNSTLTDYGKLLQNKTTKISNEIINTIVKLENSIDADVIEGKYRGVILKYDWSKKYFIAKSKLELVLSFEDGNLIGSWAEEGIDSINFKAKLTKNNLFFENTEYKKVGHYNPTISISYSFKNAKLQWQKIEDSLVLNGELQMWNNYSNEPQNAQYLYLTKYTSTNNKKQIKLFNDDGSEMKSISKLTVFPIPFSSIVNVEFANKSIQNIQISILNTDGKLVYKNDLGILSQGNYNIKLLPKEILPAGVYILKFQNGNQTKTIKIVKL